MDRQVVYVGAIPQDTDLLKQNKNTMIGLGYALQSILGTGTVVDGLACSATSPATLTVNVAPGSIMSLQNVDGTAYGSLAADTTHQIVKQGLVLDTTNLSCPAPGTTGQSINYLIQVAYQDTDGQSTVLPYYNASNPAIAYNGPNNTGVSQNTVRQGVCLVQVKAGVAATTGTQTTPSPDAGFTGLFSVTVANGQATITSGNITQLSTAPFISPKLPSVIPSFQTGAAVYAVDTSGTPNTITASISPAVQSLTVGMAVRIKIASTTTGNPVINLNGTGNVAAYDTNGNALPPGALKANNIYTFVFDGAHWELHSIPANMSFVGGGYAADTGSANAYAATISSISSLVAGVRVTVLLAHTNTTTSTFALNSFGAITIKKLSSDETGLVNVASGDLPAGYIVELEYDGTVWQALNIRGLLGSLAALGVGSGLTSSGGNLNAVNTRTTLTGNITYYVRTDGSDSNTGLVNSAGGAFLTIQKAVNVITNSLDLAGFTVTIQVVDGTYTGAVSIAAAFVGANAGGVNITGNTTTPANCVISVTGSHCFTVSNGAVISIGGFKLQTTTSGSGIINKNGGIINITGKMEYGALAAGNSHMDAEEGAIIYVNADYTISGGSLAHFNTSRSGAIICTARTITLTGTPAFSAAFAVASDDSNMYLASNTFTGSGTGVRYQVTVNASINSAGGGATYLPGNSAGTISSGGQYI